MLVRTVSVFLTLSVATHGFIFSAPAAHPSLVDFAKVQEGTLLNVALNVGTKKDQASLFLDGLGIELKMDPHNKNDHPNMPGANGPHPKLSSGVNALKVTSAPSFIGMKGIQEVKLENGCWEVVWRDGARAGAVICGFDVPEEVKRNNAGAALPAGRLYVTFPVWTRDDLEEYQEKKQKAQDRAKEHADEKERQLAKMTDTNNILKKALHFRNAAAAMERYELTGISQYKLVPALHEVIEINDDLLLTTQGTVWTKDKNLFGPDHVLLGSATARSQVNLEELAP